MAADARYHPDRDQIDLAETMGEALADLLPIARLHASPRETEAVWTELAGLGLFGIARSEAEGGSGLGIVEECLITTALGRQLAAPSIVTTLAAQPLPGVTPGATVAAAYAEDGRWIAIDAGGADFLLLRGADGARVIAAAGLDLAPVNAGLWLSELHLVATVDAPSPDAGALPRLRLLDAAALAGIALCAQEMAVAYAMVREQFGRPIGSFQAVKHSCADMAIAARCARDQVNFAAVALEGGRADAALQVESALLIAIEAAIGNAGRNIQIHGGMGFSDEADAHLVLKRARAFAGIAGGAEAALDRIAAL